MSIKFEITFRTLFEIMDEYLIKDFCEKYDIEYDDIWEYYGVEGKHRGECPPKNIIKAVEDYLGGGYLCEDDGKR